MVVNFLKTFWGLSEAIQPFLSNYLIIFFDVYRRQNIHLAQKSFQIEIVQTN